MADFRQALLALTKAAKGKVDDKLIEEVHKHMPASLLLELIAVERKSTDAFDAFVGAVENAPISWETGVCCCGDDISEHNEGSGHSPVDSGVNFIEAQLKLAKEVITEARRPILGAQL